MKSRRSILGITISVATASLVMLMGSDGNVTAWNVPVFAICGFVVFGIHMAVFIPSYYFRTDHYFDITGSVSYVSALACALILNPEITLREGILALLVAVWAIRLGSFLFLRVKKAGKDVRFDRLKNDFLAFAMTWTLSGLWVILTASTAFAALSSKTTADLEIFAYVGIFLWIIGFGIEVIADSQKTRFRSDPANANKFISHGLWAWSRHPNYFGEIVLWVGIATVAFPVLSGWQFVTLVSPIFVWFLLTKVSGIPLLERNANKKWGDDDCYRAYVASTPALIPFPGLKKTV
jgi:steroid 5-alpha reductase family enzyme